MNEFVDMHVHSKFSIDGMSTMEDYCLIAGKTGTRVICFTEHVDFNSVGNHAFGNKKLPAVVTDKVGVLSRRDFPWDGKHESPGKLGVPLFFLRFG